MALFKLMLRSLAWGANNIPDTWFDKIPGKYYKTRTAEQLYEAAEQIHDRRTDQRRHRRRGRPYYSSDEDDDDDASSYESVERPPQRHRPSHRRSHPGGRHYPYHNQNNDRDRDYDHSRTRVDSRRKESPYRGGRRSHSIRRPQEPSHRNKRRAGDERRQSTAGMDGSARDLNGWTHHDRMFVHANSAPKPFGPYPRAADHGRRDHGSNAEELFRKDMSWSKAEVPDESMSHSKPSRPSQSSQPHEARRASHAMNARRPSSGMPVYPDKSPEQYTKGIHQPFDVNNHGRERPPYRSRKNHSDSSQEHLYDSGIDDVGFRTDARERRRSSVQYPVTRERQSVPPSAGQDRAHERAVRSRPRTQYRET